MATGWANARIERPPSSRSSTDLRNFSIGDPTRIPAITHAPVRLSPPRSPTMISGESFGRQLLSPSPIEDGHCSRSPIIGEFGGGRERPSFFCLPVRHCGGTAMCTAVSLSEGRRTRAPFVLRLDRAYGWRPCESAVKWPPKMSGLGGVGPWRSGSGRSFHGHERPRASVSFPWKKWRKGRRRTIRNSFMVNSLRCSSNQCCGLRCDSVRYSRYALRNVLSGERRSGFGTRET